MDQDGSVPSRTLAHSSSTLRSLRASPGPLLDDSRLRILPRYVSDERPVLTVESRTQGFPLMPRSVLPPTSCRTVPVVPSVKTPVFLTTHLLSTHRPVPTVHDTGG